MVVACRWYCTLLVFSLLATGCSSSRQASTTKGDNQIYTRREWEVRNRASTTPGNTGNPSIGRPTTPTNPTRTDETIAESSGERAPTGRMAKAVKVISTAKTYLGTPYVYGGTSRKGLDCSALMQHAYSAVGISLPRTSRDQGKVGTPISRKAIQPGDLLFFYSSTAGVVGHAGLVVEVAGDEVKFIHAAVTGGVRMDYLSNRHWTAHYLYARRVL